MTVVEKDRTVTILRSDITRLERRTRPGRARKGAAIGASILGGTIAGLVIYECSTDCCCDGGAVLAVVSAASAIGAGVGAAAGAGTKWADVPLPPIPMGSLRLGVKFSGARALGAAVSISF